MAASGFEAVSVAVVCLGVLFVLRLTYGRAYVREARLPVVLVISVIVVNIVPGLAYLNAPHAYPMGPKYVWTHMLFILMVVLGAIIGNVLLGGTPTSPVSRFVRARSTPDSERSRVKKLAWINAIILATFVPLTGFRWPLFELLILGKGTASVNALRGEVFGPGIGPLFPIYAIARTTFIPLSFCMLLLARADMTSRNDRRIVDLGMLSAVIYCSWTSAKTPVVLLLVLAAFVYYFRVSTRSNAPQRRRESRRQRAQLLLVLFVAISYPVFVFSQKSFGQEKDVSDIFTEGVLARVSGKPAELAYVQFEIFPYKLSHLGFSDVRLLTIVTGSEYVEISSLTSEAIGLSEDSNAPPGGPANLFSQFGLAGVAVGGLVVSLILVWLERFLITSLPASKSSLAFVAFAVWLAYRISLTGVHSVVASEGIIPMICMAIIWRTSSSPAPVLRESHPVPSTSRFEASRALAKDSSMVGGSNNNEFN